MTIGQRWILGLAVLFTLTLYPNVAAARGGHSAFFRVGHASWGRLTTHRARRLTGKAPHFGSKGRKSGRNPIRVLLNSAG